MAIVTISLSGLLHLAGVIVVKPVAVVAWAGLTVVALALTRLVEARTIERLARAHRLRRRAVIVGGGEDAAELLELLNDEQSHLDILGLGTFKGPNVFGAAVAPAICYLVWLVLRRPLGQVWLPAALAMFMLPALMISFSRGAWISLAVSLLVLGVLALTRTRRSADRLRLWLFGAAGVVGLIVLVMAVLQLPEAREPDAGLCRGGRGPVRRAGERDRAGNRQLVRHRHVHVLRSPPSRGSPQRLHHAVPQCRLGWRFCLHRERAPNTGRRHQGADATGATARFLRDLDSGVRRPRGGGPRH